MSQCSRLTVAVLVASLALALPARAAQPSDFSRFFTSGVRLYKSMDFEAALEQFRLARSQPHGANDDVKALLYQGILLFELGKEAEAGETFRAALSMDPQAPLPARVSPRIEAAYLREREQFSRLVAAVPAQPVQVVGPQPEPEIVRPQPEPPVVKPQPVPEPARPQAAAVEKSAAPAKKTSALTVAGGVLTGLGLALAAGGAVPYGLAWSQNGDYQDGKLTRAEAEAMESNAGLGVGLLIAGGAVAATGVILLVLPNGTEASASLAPTPGGAAFSMRWTLP